MPTSGNKLLEFCFKKDGLSQPALDSTIPRRFCGVQGEYKKYTPATFVGKFCTTFYVTVKR